MLRNLAIVLISSALVLTATSAEAVSLRVSRESTIELRGKTNVMGWSCTSRMVRGTLDIGASASVLEALLSRTASLPPGTRIAQLPEGIEVSAPVFSAALPVRSFDCGNPIMERDMRRALKEASAPEIRFDYRSLRSVISRAPSSGASAAWEVDAQVELRLAGRTRSVPLMVRAERISMTRFRLRGAIPLRMTDFGIEPPVGLFGKIRAEDELTVSVDLVLESY